MSESLSKDQVAKLAALKRAHKLSVRFMRRALTYSASTKSSVEAWDRHIHYEVQIERLLHELVPDVFAIDGQSEIAEALSRECEDA